MFIYFIDVLAWVCWDKSKLNKQGYGLVREGRGNAVNMVCQFLRFPEGSGNWFLSLYLPSFKTVKDQLTYGFQIELPFASTCFALLMVDV